MVCCSGGRGLLRHVLLRKNKRMSDQADAARPAETFRKFVSAIDAHDVAALAALMNLGPLFVESLGNRAPGAVRMELGWRSYFVMCPDDQIQIDTLVTDGETALAPHWDAHPRKARNTG